MVEGPGTMGGGGGGGGVVSYPDPNVRNDDHRSQYDITYMSYCKAMIIAWDYSGAYGTMVEGLGTMMGGIWWRDLGLWDYGGGTWDYGREYRS